MTWCRLCGDRPASVTDAQDGVPALCGTCADAADAAMEADRLYFERHPGETVYYREPFPGESFGSAAVPDGASAMVEVRQIGPGLRTRAQYWVIPGE